MATDKQKRAAQIYVENHGKSVSAAMREAGYTEATAKNPKTLTSSDTWQELLEKALPDKKLLQVHKKMLGAKKLEYTTYPLDLTVEEIKAFLRSVGCTPKKIHVGTKLVHVWFWAPDSRGQAAAIELAYKLKGKITTQVDHTTKGQALPLLGGTTPMVEEPAPDEPEDSAS